MAAMHVQVSWVDGFGTNALPALAPLATLVSILLFLLFRWLTVGTVRFFSGFWEWRTGWVWFAEPAFWRRE